MSWQCASLRNPEGETVKTRLRRALTEYLPFPRLESPGVPAASRGIPPGDPDCPSKAEEVLEKGYGVAIPHLLGGPAGGKDLVRTLVHLQPEVGRGPGRRSRGPIGGPFRRLGTDAPDGPAALVIVLNDENKG